jgi:hypothetical protein
MQPTVGRRLRDILFSAKSGRVNPQRDHVLVGKERHDVGRPHDVGYPIRGIVKNDLLYIHNYEIERWPAGNPETGYLNCDGGATKTEILQARRAGREQKHWALAFGKRPAEEFYDLGRDPDCLNNLANDPSYRERKRQLKQEAERELRVQGDPRMFGRGKIFDRYVYANPEQRNFYERFMRGEKVKAGWVNDSDFEKEPVKQ